MTRFMDMFYEVCWMFLAALYYGVALAPCYFMVRWGVELGFPAGLFLWALTPFVFVVSLILAIGLTKKLLIPKVKPGKYKLPDSPGVYVWFANRWLADILLIPFSRLIFLNDVLRYLALRALGAQVPYRTAISSSYIVDFDLIRIGEGALIGGYVKIYPHMQPIQGHILLAPITIGAYTFIGAASIFAPGATIGDKVYIAACVTIGPFVQIEDGCQIGWHCVIGRRSHFEKNVTIGDNCRIGNNVVIKEGLTIPAFSIIPDNSLIRAPHEVREMVTAAAPREATAE